MFNALKFKHVWLKVLTCRRKEDTHTSIYPERERPQQWWMSQLKYLCYSLHLQRTHILQFLCSIYCYHRLPTTKRQEMIQTDWWRWIWFSLVTADLNYKQPHRYSLEKIMNIDTSRLRFFSLILANPKKHPHHDFKFCNHQQTLPQ